MVEILDKEIVCAKCGNKLTLGSCIQGWRLRVNVCENCIDEVYDNRYEDGQEEIKDELRSILEENYSKEELIKEIEILL